jgi:hypothetical protein
MANRPFHPEKNHPEIGLHYSWFKFSVLGFKFPARSQEFPVRLSREFCSKSAESLDERRPLSRDLPKIEKFPVSNVRHQHAGDDRSGIVAHGQGRFVPTSR